MPRPPVKSSRDQLLLLGAVCLLLLLATVVWSVLSDEGQSVGPELGRTQTPESASLDPLAKVDDDGSTRGEVSEERGAQREVLGAPAPPKVSFKGRAQDRISMQAIEGAAVKLRAGEEIVHGVTDDEGRFSVEVPEVVELDVEASAEGYLPARRAGVSIAEEVVLRLDRASSLSGLVVGPSMKEMEDSTVYVLSDDRRGERVLELDLDERGGFEVPDLEPGEFNVAVWVAGFSYGVERDVIVRPGEQTYLVFELDRAGSVSAQVLYEGTEKGIEIVEVQVDPWIQGLTRDVEEVCTLSYLTDENGRVELDTLNPGENRVRLYAPWGGTAEAKRLLIESGEHQRMTWTMKAPANCAGILLDASGAPTAGTVTVGMKPERWGYSGGGDSGEWRGGHKWEGISKVGPNGRFQFHQLPSSEALRFQGSSDVDPPQFVVVDRTLQQGGEVTNMELRMAQVVMIEGQVLDPGDQPVAYAELSTWRMQRFSDEKLLTDVEGRFSFGCLLEARGGFTVRHKEYASHYENIGSRVPDGPIVIHLKPANDVGGRVVNEDGDAVPWARVSARIEGDRRRNESTYADEFGRFSFRSLREGTWDVYPWASGYERIEMLKVEVPFDGELTLRMERVHVPDPATVRGRALLPDGTAPSRLRIERLRSAAMAVDGGEFRIYGLSPGDHYLVLEASGCAPRSLGKIVLREAEERDLGLIHMYPGIELEVVVQNAQEQRVGDARVRLEPRAGYAVDAGRGSRRPRQERRGIYSMGDLELGTWELEVRREAYQTSRQEVVLSEGEGRRIYVTLELRE